MGANTGEEEALLGPVVGLSSYDFPGNDPCAGELRLVSVAANGSQVKLGDYWGDPMDIAIHKSCFEGGVVTLSLQPNGSLALEFTEPGALIMPGGEIRPVTLTVTLTRSCTWVGDWSTNWGAMNLGQIDDTILGEYEHDEGQIEGTVIPPGNVLRETWTEAPSRQPPQDAGEFEFTMAADCQSFTGTWRYDSEGELSADWSGKRVGDDAGSPDSPNSSP